MIKRFNRFELKYIISVEKAERIIHDVLEKALPDPHGGVDGYLISSLYYDNDDLDFFWDKIEGIKYRRKIRIRVYPEDNFENIKSGIVEIKQRINRTVQKRRLKLDLKDAYKLCSSDFDYSKLDKLDKEVASEIDYLVKVKDLQPSCIIKYHRKAFMGDIYNPGLRITFDTDLRYRINNFKLDRNDEGYLFLPENYCIMEVKVNDVIPDWVTSIVSKHNCQIQRISKYCAGLTVANKIPVLTSANSAYI
ncbi:MAG: VTC domain-containing protein [Candidatus Sericytochromatia bacterium]